MRNAFLPVATAAVFLYAVTPGVRADPAPSAEAVVRQALTPQYRKLDDASKSKDSKTLFAVWVTVCTPDFVARDAQSVVVTKDKWRLQVQDDATLGGRLRPSTGNFRVVLSQQVSYETVIDKLTLSGKTATAEVRRRRLVSTVGRTASDKPREVTGEVWTDYERDRWTRTTLGWRLQETQALKKTAISSIAFLDPPAPKTK